MNAATIYIIALDTSQMGKLCGLIWSNMMEHYLEVQIHHTALEGRGPIVLSTMG